MSAYELETLIAVALLTVSGLGTLYALPSWIVRRCER